MCEKESKSKSNMKIHIKQGESIEMRQLCDYEATDKRYLERRSLKKHMLEIHAEAI